MNPLQLLKLDYCESTQDELWTRWEQQGSQAPQAIYTLDQRSGRGRRGRQWQAPAQACLCLSWRVPMNRIMVDHLWSLSFMGGVALAELMRDFGAPCFLKWPNDLLWKGKKLAGILCEARMLAQDQGNQIPNPRVVMGIGLNLTSHPQQFEQAICLQQRLQELGITAPAPDALAEVLLDKLTTHFTHLCTEGSASMMASWRRDSLPLGTKMRVAQQEGAFHGVSDTGALLLDTHQGVVSIESGEVELVREYRNDFSN